MPEYGFSVNRIFPYCGIFYAVLIWNEVNKNFIFCSTKREYFFLKVSFSNRLQWLTIFNDTKQKRVYQYSFSYEIGFTFSFINPFDVTRREGVCTLPSNKNI